MLRRFDSERRQGDESVTKPFPAMFAVGIDEPCRFDVDVDDLEVVDGEVPSDIDGLFV